MADGSVVIGVGLDLSSFTQSLTAVDMQVQALGSRMQMALAQSVGGGGMAAVMTASMQAMAQQIGALAGQLAGQMRTAASAAASAFAGAGWTAAGTAGASRLASGFAAGSGAVVASSRAVAAAASSAFSGGNWSSIGHSMMAGVASGIRAAGADVVAAIQQVSAEAEAAVKDYYAIASPSVRMREEVGVMISRGMAEGILEGSADIQRAMQAVSVQAGAVRPSEPVRQREVTQNFYLREDDTSPYRTARRMRRESEVLFRW